MAWSTNESLSKQSHTATPSEINVAHESTIVSVVPHVAVPLDTNVQVSEELQLNTSNVSSAVQLNPV